MPVSVIQICWITPSPSISASVKVVPAGIATLGETFQPTPSSRAQSAPVPSAARPPLPGAPVKFSGLIERLSAPERRDTAFQEADAKLFMNSPCGYGFGIKIPIIRRRPRISSLYRTLSIIPTSEPEVKPCFKKTSFYLLHIRRGRRLFPANSGTSRNISASPKAKAASGCTNRCAVRQRNCGRTMSTTAITRPISIPAASDHARSPAFFSGKRA